MKWVVFRIPPSNQGVRLSDYADMKILVEERESDGRGRALEEKMIGNQLANLYFPLWKDGGPFTCKSHGHQTY